MTMISLDEPRIVAGAALLDPGFELSLRPMRYPQFYDQYRLAIANTWSVEEVDFSSDLIDLRERITPAQRHVIERLVAFFATGDTIVANNLVLSLYKHINAPEARMYLSRQLFEEAQHIQFYLTLLDSYLPNEQDRKIAFSAVQHVPSIRQKAEFCFSWVDTLHGIEALRTDDDRRTFVRNLAAFAACVEGLFFFGAFAYVYYLRSLGLFNGLATGTNWVFRDESMHMRFAYSVLDTVRQEMPYLFDARLEDDIRRMIGQAIDCEALFAQDVLGEGIAGLSYRDMRSYLEFVGDSRLRDLGYAPQYHARNPFDFMELQDVQELTNFFERRVSSYQVGVQGEVSFDEAF
jgi:ribonucleoside-diphosphate reductase beta chain